MLMLLCLAGEMGSRLNNKDELDYYSVIASLAQQADSPLAGWIWWAYNANSASEPQGAG
jgi:uncharacterized protein YfcZ (UPF0381/DUF406 family)